MSAQHQSTPHRKHVEVVRLASQEDARQITSIINLAFSVAEGFFVDEDRITLAGVQALFDSGTFIVMENNHQVAGCVYFEPRGDRAYLGLLSVDPTCQGSGYGSVLMEAAEEHCRVQSMQCIDINVVNLRKELPAFYRKRGYIETGASAFPSDIKTKLPCYFIEMSKQL